MEHIPDKIDDQSYKDWLGVASDYHMKHNLSSFLYVGVKIALKLEQLRMDMGEHEKKPLIPQVIPQLTYKVRCVTFGTEQTAELCMYILRKHPYSQAYELLDDSEIPDKEEINLQNIHKRHKNIQQRITLFQKLLLQETGEQRQKRQHKMEIEQEKLLSHKH